MNLLKPSFVSFFRNKKLYIYISFIVIMVSVLIVMFNYKNGIDFIYKSEVENNVKNRTLFISNSNGNDINIHDIKLIKYIDKVEYMMEPIMVDINGKMVSLKSGIMLNSTKIIKGENIDNDNIEIIIPDSLQLGKNTLDTYIEIKYNKLTFSAKIVGIYEDKTNQNCIYVSQKIINNLKSYDENAVSSNSCIAIVNEYKNVENVIQTLSKYEYNGNLLDTSGLNDIKTYKDISIILAVSIFIIVFLIYITLSIIINNIINDERKDIAILKAVGYKNIHLVKIVFYRILILSLISYIVRILYSKLYIITIK